MPWYITYERFWGIKLIGYQEWMAPSVNEYRERKDGCASYENKLYAYSDWIHWQSVAGEKIKPYINNAVINNNFNGKFRILVDDQKLYISFNDKSFTTFSFYNYCSPNSEGVFKENGSELKVKRITKVNNNIYMFKSNFIECEKEESTCDYFYRNVSKENSAIVVIERILNDNARIKYTITVNGSEFFSEILHTLSPNELVLEDDLPKWFPIAFKGISGLSKDPKSDVYYGGISFFFLYTYLSSHNSTSLQFEFNSKYGPILCDVDGIESLTFDDASRTVKFYLKGRAEYGTVDYVVLKVMNESPLGQNDKKNKSGFYTRRGTLTFYKENPNGEDIVVKHFDENHTEFSVIGLVKNELTV